MNRLTVNLILENLRTGQALEDLVEKYNNMTNIALVLMNEYLNLNSRYMSSLEFKGQDVLPPPRKKRGVGGWIIGNINKILTWAWRIADKTGVI